MPVTRDGQIIGLSVGNSAASLSLYGCTILSFKPQKSNEILFLSSKAKLDNSKPIRGGIPLVFPQFGPGILPQHGFARKSVWSEESITETSTCLTATFTLFPSQIPPEQRKLWDFDFKLVYEIILTDTLKTTLKVINTDSRSFKFTALLHTYLLNLDNALIKGLDGFGFVEFGKTDTQSGDLKIAKEVDRIYSCPGKVSVGRVEVERSETLENVVVW